MYIHVLYLYIMCMGQSLGGARDIKKVKSFDVVLNVHGMLLKLNICIHIKIVTIFRYIRYNKL